MKPCYNGGLITSFPLPKPSSAMRLRARKAPWLIGASVLIVGAIVLWYGAGRPKTAAASTPAEDAPATSAVAVEVTAAKPGGIDRICRQPGSCEPIEFADLYSKVSGFLIEQQVDIGDAVKVGQVLARVAVPENEKQLKQDEADVARAEARRDQMKAAISTAQADLGSAKAAIALAEADKKSKDSYRAFREKQRDRIRDLAARQAVDVKLAEEHEDLYQAAFSADLVAGEAIGAAKQKELGARARVEQAHGDLRYADAELASAKARLERTQVLVDYATIRSPYTGVVSKRNFHPGDFVRSADSGGDRMPVLAVERTDVMRVVVQVPERDVPFVDRGDPAIVEFDALPGVVYKSQGDTKVEVSRLASSEDSHTRMMRTEVHLKNADGKVRRGMYARVTLMLQVGSSGACRLPSTALTGKADGGKGFVRVVRNSAAQFIPVVYGADNGSEVEILSGLDPSDRIIVRTSAPLENGTSVVASEAKAAGGH